MATRLALATIEASPDPRTVQVKDGENAQQRPERGERYAGKPAHDDAEVEMSMPRKVASHENVRYAHPKKTHRYENTFTDGPNLQQREEKTQETHNDPEHSEN